MASEVILLTAVCDEDGIEVKCSQCGGLLKVSKDQAEKLNEENTFGICPTCEANLVNDTTAIPTENADIKAALGD